MSEPLRVLLVEDDDVDRRAVERVLRGYAISPAPSLAAALELLASEEPFDCVLLDLNLPDGEGVQLITRLGEGGHALAPVIVLTGHRDEDLVDGCLQAGAQDYLVKGQFDADALQRAIRYSRERHAQAAALRRSNQELERFAHAASHDLQEPVRTLRAMGQRLQERAGDALAPKERALLERMLGATDRMQTLIADLLELSKVSQNELPHERVELEQLVHELRTDLALRLNETQATLEAGRLPAVRGVESLLRRLLTNLVGNSLKFRDPARAPRVEISARALPPKQKDSFGERSARPRVELCVADNGIGIDPERSAEIFLAFKRLHARTRYPGTGIGLAICEAIVVRHGGRIRAEPTAGGGLTIVLTLPAA